MQSETLEEWRHEASHSSVGALAVPFESDEMLERWFEDHLCNSEFDWIRPEDNGDLTDAPILGVLDDPDRRYGFMDYQIKSVLSELLQTGRVIFIGPN